MKTTLMAIFLTFSLPVLADNCEQARNQLQLNNCTARLVKSETDLLIKKITNKCNTDPVIRIQQGGTLHKALLNECIASEIKEIRKNWR